MTTRPIPSGETGQGQSKLQNPKKLETWTMVDGTEPGIQISPNKNIKANKKQSQECKNKDFKQNRNEVKVHMHQHV